MADDNRHDTAALLALHRARLRLYRRQSALIAAAALPHLQRIDTHRLTANLALLAGFDRRTRAAQAATTITGALWTTGTGPDSWDDTNTTAAQASTARGWAEADATLANGGTPSTGQVRKHLERAAAVAAAVAIGGADWTNRQVGRLAWDLSADTLLTGDNPEHTIRAALTDGGSVRAAAEDSMHAAWGNGLIARLTAGAQHGNELVSWLTLGDERVCPTCEANEAEGPYPPDQVPSLPAHPSCRCSLVVGT